MDECNGHFDLGAANSSNSTTKTELQAAQERLAGAVAKIHSLLKEREESKKKASEAQEQLAVAEASSTLALDDLRQERDTVCLERDFLLQEINNYRSASKRETAPQDSPHMIKKELQLSVEENRVLQEQLKLSHSECEILRGQRDSVRADRDKLEQALQQHASQATSTGHGSGSAAKSTTSHWPYQKAGPASVQPLLPKQLDAAQQECAQMKTQLAAVQQKLQDTQVELKKAREEVDVQNQFLDVVTQERDTALKEKDVLRGQVALLQRARLPGPAVRPAVPQQPAGQLRNWLTQGPQQGPVRAPQQVAVARQPAPIPQQPAVRQGSQCLQERTLLFNETQFHARKLYEDYQKSDPKESLKETLLQMRKADLDFLLLLNKVNVTNYPSDYKKNKSKVCDMIVDHVKSPPDTPPT